MKTPSQFDEWLQAAYEIADKDINRIALPVGTYTAKSILKNQSKQCIGYKGANYRLNSYDSKVRQARQTETEGDDKICMLNSSSGATYRFNRSTLFKVIKELESKAGVRGNAIRTWDVEDQRIPKFQFHINLPSKKTMKGLAKMTKNSILIYSLAEGKLDGKDELGNQISIPIEQDSDQPLPDIKFKLYGLDLEHLSDLSTVKLYYDLDEKEEFKDIQLTIVSDDDWIVGLDTSHSNGKGWQKAFQYYPDSYNDDRYKGCHPIQISSSQDLDKETKSHDTLTTKEESSSVDKNGEHTPSPTVNKNDQTLLSHDCPSKQSIASCPNHQESTITDQKLANEITMDRTTSYLVEQGKIKFIMPSTEDISILERFDEPEKETRALACSGLPTENKRDASFPSGIDELAKEFGCEAEPT